MKKINPNLIKLAEQTHNPDLKIDESILEKNVKETVDVPSLDGYIYVPPINLYVAKEKTLHGKDWYQTHKELHKQGLQMLTIPEFIKFIKYLKGGIRHPRYQDREEAKQILDEILTAREPLRGEQLDASFKVINGELYINYNHRTINGELKPGKSEPLEDCLMKDKGPGIDLDYWLKNPTKQGLPRKNTPGGKLDYWFPLGDDNSVAGLYVNSHEASLSCCWGPGSPDSRVGVRAAKIKE